MPRHNFAALEGRLERISVDAPSLRDNALGDPSQREVAVYLPATALNADRPLPLLVGLAAYTGSGLKLMNWESFGESMPQRIDRLTREGKLAPAVYAFPDAFTSLGGNQYVDSPILGNWSQFLRGDLVDALTGRFPVDPSPRRRGLFGHSSGGYGAWMQALTHAEAWGAIAAHSADMGFELLYRSDLPKALRALAPHDGRIPDFLAALEASARMRGDDFYALMMVAMAASYDPRTPYPEALRLPVDLHTCELDVEAWSRWCRFDPLVALDAPGALDGLRSLRGLYFDCGSRDEYNLQFGARRMQRRLEAADIAHVYEEFPDGHSKVAYRYDRSLPWLVETLNGD